MRRILPYIPYLFLVPLSVLNAVTTINLWQIKAPMGQGVGILYTTNGGAVVPGKIAGMSVDSFGNITLIGPLSIPATSVTKVVASTPNLFPIPQGRTYCMVFRNIPQAPAEDYTINGTNIVFNTPPAMDDIVQLMCF